MSEQEQQDGGLEIVSEYAELRFRKLGPFVIAELGRRDGKDPILLATIRPTLINTPDTAHLWQECIDVLLNQLMGRAGVEMIRGEPEVRDERKADD